MRVASSFGFNASAVAFGGLIKPPRVKKSKPINGVASVALAPSGGVSESFTKRYKQDGVSFKDALSRVEGTIDGDVYTTISTVQLEKLDIFGRIKCDAMQAVIKSSRATKDADPKFAIKATFDGLRIADANVRPPMNLPLFGKIATYGQFVDFFTDEDNLTKFGPSFGWMGEGDRPDPLLLQSAREGKLNPSDPIRCSLLTSKIDQGAAFRQDGYTLIVDGLGKIHLAEVLVKPAHRRINMLRLELQTPQATGRTATAARNHTPETLDGTVCYGEGNGSHTYP